MRDDLDLRARVAAIGRETGRPSMLRLGMMESYKAATYIEGGDEFTVMIRSAKVAENSRTIKVTKRGVRFVTFTRHGSLWHVVVENFWTETCDEVHHKFRSATPDPEWEKLCYRPGNARFPQDREGI